MMMHNCGTVGPARGVIEYQSRRLAHASAVWVVTASHDKIWGTPLIVRSVPWAFKASPPCGPPPRNASETQGQAGWGSAGLSLRLAQKCAAFKCCSGEFRGTRTSNC
eukprot:1870887-Rhodomonas_salina.4